MKFITLLPSHPCIIQYKQTFVCKIQTANNFENINTRVMVYVCDIPPHEGERLCQIILKCPLPWQSYSKDRNFICKAGQTDRRTCPMDKPTTICSGGITRLVTSFMFWFFFFFLVNWYLFFPGGQIGLEIWSWPWRQSLKQFGWQDSAPTKASI